MLIEDLMDLGFLPVPADLVRPGDLLVLLALVALPGVVSGEGLE